MTDDQSQHILVALSGLQRDTGVIQGRLDGLDKRFDVFLAGLETIRREHGERFQQMQEGMTAMVNTLSARLDAQSARLGGLERWKSFVHGAAGIMSAILAAILAFLLSVVKRWWNH